ncbi:MAG TPA: ABC transporter substrate-binding protein [Nitrospinota bacterium]|jgi:NitT/TauT family transport system substrate-binding protein|nr:ABC transporter substrate-binding protein [Nitrospinota bacterium]
MKTHFGKAVRGCLVTLALATLGWGAQAQAAEKASLRLSWILQANFAPFFYGLDKGFYKAEGIDLTIHEGRGSSLSAKLVAQKKNTFGITDVGVAIKSIEKGLPIKVVWCHFQQTPIAVLSLAKNPIRRPKDLIGKRVASRASSSMTILFGPMLRRNGVDPSKVMLTSSNPPYQPLLLAGKVDAMMGYWVDGVPKLEAFGVKVNAMKFYDWGMNILSNGITTHQDTIKAKPGLVRGFVKASARSWKEARTDTGGAIDSLLKRMAKGKRATQLKNLKNAFQILYTKNSRGKPLGWMSPKDWQDTVDTLYNTKLIKVKSPIGRYYTNEFVPGS